MNDSLPLFAAPFAACLILTVIHCYLGLHVVARGVIFVDLALAQVAALGGAVGMLAGYDLHGAAGYLFSLGFALLGATLFALARFRDERVPQEAIIGITYAVTSAAAILILDRAPHGSEEIKTMLLGNILFTDWSTVWNTLWIYLGVALLHFLCRRRFFGITLDIAQARRNGWHIWFWDLLFYASFGLVVTSSVHIAGVLLVFTYLVVPAVCAVLFVDRLGGRLILGWFLGLLGSAGGLYLSFARDLPTGASIVTMFGLLTLASVVIHGLRLKFRGRRQTPSLPGY